MTILHLDGAELYGSTNNADVSVHVGRKWGTVVDVWKLSTTVGRYGGKSLYPATTVSGGDRNNCSLKFDSGAGHTSLFISGGFQWKAGNGDSTTHGDNIHVMEFLDSGGTVIFSVSVSEAADWSELIFWKGSTAILTIATGQTTGMFHLELDIAVDATTGHVIAYINGIEIDRFEGDTGSVSIQQLRLQTGGDSGTVDSSTGKYREYYVDDLCWSDAHVPGCRTSTTKALTVNADSALSDEWGRSAGTDAYALVDEAPANDDTDYIYAENSGEEQAFNFTTLTTSPGANDLKTIHGVMIQAVARNEGLSASLQLFLSDGVSNYNIGSAIDPGGLDYAVIRSFQSLDTASVPFTLATINTLEAGIAS